MIKGSLVGSAWLRTKASMILSYTHLTSSPSKHTYIFPLHSPFQRKAAHWWSRGRWWARPDCAQRLPWYSCRPRPWCALSGRDRWRAGTGPSRTARWRGGWSKSEEISDNGQCERKTMWKEGNTLGEWSEEITSYHKMKGGSCWGKSEMRGDYDKTKFFTTNWLTWSQW